MSGDPAQTFSGRSVAVIIAVAVTGFIAFLLLLAFGSDARSGHDARAHALSVSGDGFAGLVALTEGVGFATLVARDRAALTVPSLLIAAPPVSDDGTGLAALLAQRQRHPTLIVLPKWVTQPQRANRAWAEAVTTYPATLTLAPLHALASGVRLGMQAVPIDSAPMRLGMTRIGGKSAQQRLAPAGLDPILIDAAGRVVLGRLPGKPIYLLAEPDLFDNAGLADAKVAYAAMTVIDQLAPNNEIAFDVTLNGLGTTHGTLRLLFEPPFLPATLCLVLAGLLAGLHGAVRFGAPAAPPRAIAFGKAALLDNMAVLVRVARKEQQLGSAYASMVLAEAAAAAGMPADSGPEALARQLDATRKVRGHPAYSVLAAAASAARNRPELVAAARALHRWMRNGTA